MSVRAYRVITKELAEHPSFNCWHDVDIVDFMTQEPDCNQRVGDFGSGTIEVSVSVLEKLLKEFQWTPENERSRDAIKADVAWAKKNNQDIIEYDCF